MSSIQESLILAASAWPSPPLQRLTMNKYFVNQEHTNSSDNSIDNSTNVSNNNAIEQTKMINSSSIINTNKYFVSNVSLMSNENVMDRNRLVSSTMSPTIAPTSAPVSKKKTKDSLSSTPPKTSGGGAANQLLNVKTNGTGRATSTHFQIAQKQLTLSKNTRTEPPPQLNHILDSLSVSNSKHLHHDNRQVLFNLIK